MRTQSMNHVATGIPWIEYYEAGTDTPNQLELGKFPFVIGRDDLADFSVDSGRVSRRHLAIEKETEAYRLRDLESTNGTYLNGERVTEAGLSDGDVIVIADFELTFHAGEPEKADSATQVMTELPTRAGTESQDLVFQVRRFHEILTHRALRSRFQPVVRLEDGRVFGYEATYELDDWPGGHDRVESIVRDTECRLAERIRQQHRILAIEQAGRLQEDIHLFVGLQVSEVGSESLPESLFQVIDMSTRSPRLVIDIPDTAVCDIPYFRQFIQRLRDRGVQVGYANFRGSPAQITGWHAIAPDFLKLSASLVRGISRSSDGGRTLQTMVEAAGEVGCMTIALGVDDRADAECVAEIGCRYGQGGYFGPAQPINLLCGSEVAASSSG